MDFEIVGISGRAYFYSDTKYSLDIVDTELVVFNKDTLNVVLVMPYYSVEAVVYDKDK